MSRAPSSRGPKRLIVRFTPAKAFAAALALLLAFHAALLLIAGVLTLLYSFINPPITTLMLYRRLVDGHSIQPLRYLPLQRIPRYAQRMFVQVEDHTFYRHPGIDLKAIRDAYRINRRLGAIYYGGSTITQQLARTLFLSPRRTYLRKYAEMLIALEMDLLLTKRRILELYLNYIEFGPGVYGLGAAARYHYGKPAADLQLDEYRRLATLAASPLRYTTLDFGRRRALSERYEYLLRAFPDPATASEPGTPPPPELQGRTAREEEAESEPESQEANAVPPSGGGVQTGVVVPETQTGEGLPEPVQQGEDP